MGLCCLGDLLGLCGFCVRERLGGLEACCVFAFLFILFVLLPLSFCLSFYLFAPAFVLLSLCFCVCYPLLVLLSCLSFPALFVVSFSLSDYMQKERAQFLASSLRVLCVA